MKYIDCNLRDHQRHFLFFWYIDVFSRRFYFFPLQSISEIVESYVVWQFIIS